MSTTDLEKNYGGEKLTKQGTGLFPFLNSKQNALDQKQLISNCPALLQSLNIKTNRSILSFLFC